MCQARAVQADAACEDLEVEAGGESVAPEELALGRLAELEKEVMELRAAQKPLPAAGRGIGKPVQAKHSIRPMQHAVRNEATGLGQRPCAAAWGQKGSPRTHQLFETGELLPASILRYKKAPGGSSLALAVPARAQLAPQTPVTPDVFWNTEQAAKAQHVVDQQQMSRRPGGTAQMTTVTHAAHSRSMTGNLQLQSATLPQKRSRAPSTVRGMRLPVPAKRVRPAAAVKARSGGARQNQGDDSDYCTEDEDDGSDMGSEDCALD